MNSINFNYEQHEMQNGIQLKKSNGQDLKKEIDFNDYEAVRVVGQGAYGTAVLYRKKIDNKLVVVKEINMHNLTSTERLLAMNEAKVLSMLDHNNIVKYYNSYECDGKIFIEMEYCDGGTLADFLNTLSKPLKEHEILIIFLEIVSAITYLHDKNILHRDLKTANIFLTSQRVVKLGDFGIAKMLSTKKKDANTVVGTPYYISPEMFQGKFYDKKTDIWSLGCILYEMACLQKTFEESNLAALVMKIVKGHFAPIKRGYSRDFKKLVDDLLRTNPDCRPMAYEIYEEVRQLLTNQVILTQKEAFSNETTNQIYLSSQFKNTFKYPRSIIYEIKIKEPNINLSEIRLPKDLRIKEISKGSNHFLALTYDYNVYAWGSTDHGQLGNKHSMNSVVSKPSLMEDLRGKYITSVRAGDKFSVLLSKNGLVMTCGDGSYGCLGREVQKTSSIPKLVDTIMKQDIFAIEASEHHVLGLSNNGEVFAWGLNKDGRLGVGKSIEISKLPQKVSFLGDVKIVKIFCGINASMFIDENGSIWATGDNDQNKLGLNEYTLFDKREIRFQFEPTKLLWLKKKVKSIFIGKNNTAFLLESGPPIIIGSNDETQLGQGNDKSLRNPQSLTSLQGYSINKILCGSSYVICSDDKNSVFFWGTRSIKSSGEMVQEDESSDGSDVLKIAGSNTNLMKIIEQIGPDYPIVVIKDPIMQFKPSELDLLKSTQNQRKDVILKPQTIIALYSSQAHLQYGETFSLSDIYIFYDDTAYLKIDTTIPLPARKANLNSTKYKYKPRLSILPEGSDSQVSLKVIELKHRLTNQFEQTIRTGGTFDTQKIPLWLKNELDAEATRKEKANSFPYDFKEFEQVKIKILETELDGMRKAFEKSNDKISEFQNQIKELKEEIKRLRQNEEKSRRKKHMKCFIQ